MLVMDQLVQKMREVVFAYMKKQEEAGKLSLAHSYDHVDNVGRYAGIIIPYLGKRLGVSDIDQLSSYAESAGLAHDIIRYATETGGSEEDSALHLERIYDAEFSHLISRPDYQRFIVDIVRNSKANFTEAGELYRSDPQTLVVGLAVTAGDKLIEASGPRVLERRSFFVGRERMLDKNDLGAVFTHPTDSEKGVLSETMIRLGDINHVSNYAAFPALLRLAEELHSPQYQLYEGLLRYLVTSEEDARDYLLKIFRGSIATKKLADRFERGSKRLVDEQHLSGRYFEEHNLPTLLHTVKNFPDDLRESTHSLIQHFATNSTPAEAIRLYEGDPFGPPTFRQWMGDIAAYRRGDFGQELIERLEREQ